MKRLTIKNIALFALSLLCVTCMLVGGIALGKTQTTVYAAEDTLTVADKVSSLKMVDGASIRLDSETHGGLRFRTQILKTEYDALVAEYGEENVILGTLIAPDYMLESKGEFSMSNANLTENVDYLNIVRTTWYNTNGEYYVFSAVISDLNPVNYDKDFVARSYVKVGEDVYYSANYDEAGRNAVYVASAGKVAGMTGEQIDNYINAVSGYASPVLSLNVSNGAVINVGESVEVIATLNGTRVFPTLSVNNGNLTVSNANIIGAVAGDATVTATFTTADGVVSVTKDVNITVQASAVLANGTSLSYEASAADYVLNVPAGDVKILQLTSALLTNGSELDAKAFNLMDEVVSTADPDFIVVTGDMVDGLNDATGAALAAFINKMDSFGIYWGVALGDKDLAGDYGVDNVISAYKNSTYCLLADNTLDGNCDTSIAIKQGNSIVKVLYLFDTATFDGLTSEQLNWFARTQKEFGDSVTALAFMHNASSQVAVAQNSYNKANGDFGTNATLSSSWSTAKENRFWSLLKSGNVNGLFVGEETKVNSSVLYDGIRVTFGLKTGTFGEYTEGELGGTLATVKGADLRVEHVYGSVIVTRHSYLAPTEYVSTTSNSGNTFKEAYSVVNNENYLARYTIKSENLVTAYSGTADKNVIYFTTRANEDGSYDWAINYGVMLMYKADGLCLYGWSDNGWTNRTVYLTAAQLDLISSANGLDMLISYDGSQFIVWLETAEGTLSKIMWAGATGRYFVGHQPDVYSNNAAITLASEAYTYTGLNSTEEAAEFIFDGEYTLNSFVYNQLSTMASTTFENLSSNKPFEATYKTNTGYLARYNIKSATLETAYTGTADKNVVYFNTYTNTTGTNNWDTNYGVMLMYKADGLCLYGWSNSNWTNRTVYLNATELALLKSAGGMDMLFTFDGSDFAVWLETTDGVLAKIMWAGAAGRYFVAHKGDVYSGNASLSISCDTYSFNGATNINEAINKIYSTYTIGNRLSITKLVSETNVTNDETRNFGNGNVSNKGYMAKYTIKSSDLGTSNKGNAIYFNTYTNTDGSTTVGPNLGVMLTYDGDKLGIKGWSNSSWTTTWAYFTAAQKELLAGANGIDMLFTYDGNEFGVWLETSEGTIQKVMSSPSSWVAGKYICQANADFYTNNGYNISISYEVYNISGAGSMINMINAIYPSAYTIA